MKHRKTKKVVVAPGDKKRGVAEMRGDPKIKFERLSRICPTNDELRAAGKTRGLIYDFIVTIDGVWRATLSKQLGRGYRLLDPDGQGINVPGYTENWAGAECKRQADFTPFIMHALEQEVIPTAAEFEKIRAKRKTEKETEEARAAEVIRRRKIEAVGVDLYDALVDLEAALRADSRGKTILSDTVEYHLDGNSMYLAINKARRAIAKADGRWVA